MNNKKVAIIGSGISGSFMANKLQDIADVTIFEKARGIGGRMTTRRSDDFHFDHGAQFFVAKNQEFKDLCQNLYKKNIIATWDARFAEIEKNDIVKKWQFDNIKQPHYVALPTMNGLCKYLCKNLEVKLNNRITNINYENNKWSLQNADLEVFDNFDYLILAIPSHQAIDLLPKDSQFLDILQNIKMTPCYALMLGFEKKIEIEFDAALVKENIISWISINSSKSNRPEGFSLLINSTNQWAHDNIDLDLDIVKEKLILELQKIVNFDVKGIKYENIHRWRYANCAKRSGEESLFDESLNLGICGDYFISGRVESAFMSANNLLKKLNL